MLHRHDPQDRSFQEVSMKGFSRLLILGTVLLVATFAVAAQQPAPTAQQPGQPPAQAAQDQTFQGSLVKVDPETKMLTAKGADNKEMQFSYTDQTEVLGQEKTIQGLATKAGAPLKITYRVERGANRATKIESSAPAAR
jgi:hypothetical protein